MPLPRTRTFGMQDVVLSVEFASATVAATGFVVSPIHGYVERILVVRASAHSAPQQWSFTIGDNPAKARNGANGGAERDVDSFEFPEGSANGIAAGGAVAVFHNGVPAETTKLAVFVVIRRK